MSMRILSLVICEPLLMFLVFPDRSYALPETAYLCVPTISVGFTLNKTTGLWRPANFSVSGTRYLLKKQPVGWAWSEFGATGPADKCDDVNQGGYIDCHGLVMNIMFDQKTLRFQEIQPFGYVGGLWRMMPGTESAEGADTPFIEIGSCTPF
jgi:hypothetical protein